MRTTHRTPEEVQSAGLAALQEALSPSEMVMFIANWPFGRGNYTEERHQLLEDGSVADVVAEKTRQRDEVEQPA
jgi:hypothetical protein